MNYWLTEACHFSGFFRSLIPIRVGVELHAINKFYCLFALTYIFLIIFCFSLPPTIPFICHREQKQKCPPRVFVMCFYFLILLLLILFGEGMGIVFVVGEKYSPSSHLSTQTLLFSIMESPLPLSFFYRLTSVLVHPRAPRFGLFVAYKILPLIGYPRREHLIAFSMRFKVGNIFLFASFAVKQGDDKCFLISIQAKNVIFPLSNSTSSSFRSRGIHKLHNQKNDSDTERENGKNKRQTATALSPDCL